MLQGRTPEPVPHGSGMHSQDRGQVTWRVRGIPSGGGARRTSRDARVIRDPLQATAFRGGILIGFGGFSREGAARKNGEDVAGQVFRPPCLGGFLFLGILFENEGNQTMFHCAPHDVDMNVVLRVCSLALPLVRSRRPYSPTGGSPDSRVRPRAGFPPKNSDLYNLAREIVQVAKFLKVEFRVILLFSTMYSGGVTGVSTSD